MQRRTLVYVAVSLGLLVGLIASLVATTSAAPDDPGRSTIYFPWVPNNDRLAGVDGITGAITVQNLEVFPVDVTIEDAAGNELTTLTLNPRASQTWTANDLGLPEPGAGVTATATWNDIDDLIGTADVDFICSVGSGLAFRGGSATPVPSPTPTAIPSPSPSPSPTPTAIPSPSPSPSPTPSPTPSASPGMGGTFDSVAVTPAPPSAGAIEAVVVRQGGFTFPADSYTWQYAGGRIFIDWSPSGPEPAEGSDYEVLVIYNCPPPRIAGVEKHTVGTAGVQTTSSTALVDGYSAVPVQDLARAGDGGVVLEGQSRWVLPIVQTNSGWNTAIVITNVAGRTTAVNATFYAAAGQGYAGESEMLLSGQVLAAGESVVVDLREYGFPEGVVGSVWVDGTHAVVAVAFRHKPATDMLLTTVAQPRHDPNNGVGTYEHYGPLVFRDYNGWNTGINIANLSSEDNQVSVTYYNYAGNVVAAETRTIPARAMEYVYTPATGNFGLADSQITAVRIAGDYPLAAAIDEVKYLGGQGEGHAMSYAAGRAQVGGDAAPLANGRVLYESMLGLPLVQKGNPTTGSGDTSGINLFNPDPEFGVNAYVQFVDSAGVPVAPTVNADDSEAPIVLPLGAHAGATVYTLNYSEMPAGFQGSAVVGVVGDGALVGVSNNVNYDVGGDGSAVYNLTVTDQASFGLGSDFSYTGVVDTAE